MILDYRNRDHTNPWDWEILNAETEEPLPMEPPWGDIFYADDSTGLLRVNTRDKEGRKTSAWKELHRPIRIVPKHDFSPETSWRNRAALL